MRAALRNSGRQRHSRSRLVLWLLVGVGVLVLVAANANLVYVALASQPDCVAHLKTQGHDGTYRAARPSC